MSRAEEWDLTQRFAAFLTEERHYPPESLVPDYPLVFSGQVLRPDLVITDVERTKVIAVVEFQRESVERKQLDLTHVYHYASGIGQNVPGYLVAPSIAGFDIFTRGLNNRTVRVDSDGFPSYTGLVAASRAREGLEAKSERRAVIDYFRWTCYVLALGALFLFVLSVTDKIDLSSEELALLGACIGLILIPGAAKLKILGIEFERLAQEDRRVRSIEPALPGSLPSGNSDNAVHADPPPRVDGR